MNDTRRIRMPLDPRQAEASAPTMADVLTALEVSDVDARRRRDLSSAVRRLCALAGREPPHFPADMTSVRSAFQVIHPAQADISPKTLANLQSNVAAAVRFARGRGLPASGRVELAAEWQGLRDRLPTKRLRNGLSRFVRFCSSEGIPPDHVTDQTLDDFADWLRRETLVTKVNDLHRRTANLWNEATGTVPGWPQQRLSIPDFRQPRWTTPLERFSASFRKGVEAHLEWLGGNDPFCAHPPPKVCKPSTIRLRRKHIEIAASCLVSRGTEIAEIGGLADLVAPENFKKVLLHYLERRNGEPDQFLRDLAKTLILIARHWLRVDAEHLSRLQDLRRRLGPDRSGLTVKNRETLRQFDDPHNVSLLLGLPAKLVRAAERRPAGDVRAAVQVQVALAIEILLMAPMRMANLGQLRIDRHVRPFRNETHLVLPGSETKNGDEATYPVSGETKALLELYLARYRPRLCADPTSWLFCTGMGGRKTQATLSQQVSAIIAKHTGLQMTPHQFRHLAAKLLLAANPGNFEAVRQLLGHCSIKSTTSFYTGLQTPEIARDYNRMLTERRQQLAEEIAPTRAARRRRSRK